MSEKPGKKIISEWRYKYQILLRLRDHEHTVLWQKFNVFLIFNSILITILSAVFILFKNEISLVQNVSSGSVNIAENASQFSLSPALCFITFCISLVAYICSIFSLKIVRGSDFWIDFYEGKLRLFEINTSKETEIGSIIYGDHPTSIRKIIDENENSDSKPITIWKRIISKILGDTQINTPIQHIQSESPKLNNEDIIKLKKIYSNHVEKGYISTRKNMRYFIRTIVCIWASVVIFSGTGFIFIFFNIYNKPLSNGLSYSIFYYGLILAVPIILFIIVIGIYRLLKRTDEKDNESYITQTSQD